MTKPQSNFSQLKDFLGYLTTVKGDLSNITAPPFVLSPKSVTEIPASWAEHHKLFLQPAREDDAEKRALLVLKNFLCSLKRQVYTAATETSDGGAKKPLNAFLGELFLGTFDDHESGSKTQLISEQVSHHPPVTACFFYNKEHRISSAGYVAQETTFSPTNGVVVKQVGHAIIRDETHGESHLMTLPVMAIKGLVSGSPYPELQGTCYISSSSGYLSTIDFSGKKALGFGTKNCVTAELINLRQGGKVLYEATGQWNGKLSIKDRINGTKSEAFDVDSVPHTELTVKPIEDQSPWESRRAWKGVLKGIENGDMQIINDVKGRIENAQRDVREAEEKAGVDWHRVFFRKSNTHEEFDVLARGIPDPEAKKLNQDRTAGVWRFIGINPAEKILKSGEFHSTLEPTGQMDLNKKAGSKPKVITTRADRIGNLVNSDDVKKAIDGKVYKCPHNKMDGTGVCGSLITPTDSSVSSHESTLHKPNSRYSQKQSSSKLPVIIGCVGEHGGCERDTEKKKWTNFNNYLHHHRTVHHWRKSELELMKILQDRARKNNDRADGWYHVDLEKAAKDKDEDGSEEDDDSDLD
ncbi:oxysterol binding protein [Seiridium cupressi]